MDTRNRTLRASAETRLSQPGCSKISIVTCSFEQGRYLDAAIRSVLEQRYPALEYIVVDGGSGDDSVQIIRHHGSALAYWISEPDRGQTDALIKGFARATGDICGWLCSDDMLLPGALHEVNGFFAAHPEVMAAYGDALWIDGEGRFLRPKKETPFSRFVFLHDHNFVPQPSMFWRRRLYEAVGGLDPEFDLAMDADLWDRFSARTRIMHIPRYLSCMRFYPQQKTRRSRREGRIEDGIIRRRNSALAAHGFSRALLHVLARCMRVSAKAVGGAYAAQVPAEHLAWIEESAVGEHAQ
ncbi:MAG: glycosyltransferase [Burkholderiales bacterium]|nr:glycosyltransferase [Burkholderiales bacterium]